MPIFYPERSRSRSFIRPDLKRRGLSRPTNDRCQHNRTFPIAAPIGRNVPKAGQNPQWSKAAIWALTIPLPRHGERPPTAPPRERRPQHFPAARPPPAKGWPPGRRGRTARPRGGSACGAAIRRRTLFGQGGAARQCASSAPLHQVSIADPRQPIVTARPRPGNGARRREAWLRAVERGRAASPARGVT